MLVKSNTQLWRNKGVFGEGPWGIWLICQGSAMGQGYTPHMSVANKQWLFLLDIHWRNNFGPLQCRGKANSCFRPEKHFGIIRRTDQIRDPSLRGFSLKHFTVSPLGHWGVFSVFQHHPAKSISSLFLFVCFFLDDWWICGSAHSVTQVLPPAKWRGLQSWTSLCFQPNLSSRFWHKSKQIHPGFFLLSTFIGISLELLHWSTKECFYCCHSVIRFPFGMFLCTFQNRTKPTIVGFLWDWNCAACRNYFSPSFILNWFLISHFT